MSVFKTSARAVAAVLLAGSTYAAPAQATKATTKTAAAKTTRLRRMIAAGDCPRETKTTSVAPINPTSANSCQGGSVGEASLIEVSELIFEARVELGVDRRSGGRHDQVPRVEVDLIDRPDQPTFAAGEPTPCAIPAAIGNAVFDATGARLREVPFTPDRVKAALRRPVGS